MQAIDEDSGYSSTWSSSYDASSYSEKGKPQGTVSRSLPQPATGKQQQLEPKKPPPPQKIEMRRVGAEVIDVIVARGTAITTQSYLKQAVLAVEAGALVAFGALISVAISTDIASKGAAALLFGIGFVGAFGMAILAGTTLFTEVNMVFPIFMLARGKKVVGPTIVSWVITLVGNYVGTLLFSLTVSGAMLWHYEPLWIGRLSGILSKKILMVEAVGGAKAWFSQIVSGAIANYAIGMATFLASEGRDVPSKFAAILFPVVGFAVIGAAHSPALFGLTSLALVEGASKFGITWGKTWAWSLAPAIIGNFLGGCILVSFPFFIAFNSKK